MTVSDGGPRAQRATEGREIPTLAATLSSTGNVTVPLEDCEVHVCQDGPRGAPALLLIHGSAASARSWDPLVPLLTGAHRVIRVDLPGHGRSAKADDLSYATRDQARRVGEVLDRLGAGPVVVAGHSSGGVVATALAVQRPDLVTALALIDTGPSMAAFIAAESAALDPSAWPPPDEPLMEFASTGFSRPGYRIPREFLDDLRAMTFHTLTATMRGTTEYLLERPLPDRLAPLGKPLLVIFGEDDRRWRSSSAADYRAVPGARIELLPGLGHSPNLEDPPATAAALLPFTTAHAR
ncbi:alpha/beta fold hydrolase [Bailinhaonella thermotolerans]|uniref:Alpha/beta hydrolase n=1 Tax=Bailinhaonella thermotolerans TaxID=1070861 RepID=A0A3A4B198_9ACTN|nr:alpha/beta hydrolase [Bailinhaonella thermotolerans]RJL35505.1 alpha/beta hydrolase [Bailinhaonella thermotolerans]